MREFAPWSCHFAPRAPDVCPVVATWLRLWTPPLCEADGTRASMARHFTQSAAYRDFKLSDVKSEAEAFLVLSEFAFGDRKTFACPICGSVGDHYLRKTRKQWRCRDCDSTFSPTSGTALHKRKISCLTLVRAILMYSVASNGKSASQAGAELGVDRSGGVCGSLVPRSVPVREGADRLARHSELPGNVG